MSKKSVPKRSPKYMIVVDEKNERTESQVLHFCNTMKEVKEWKPSPGYENGDKRLFKVSHKFLKDLK